MARGRATLAAVRRSARVVVPGRARVDAGRPGPADTSALAMPQHAAILFVALAVMVAAFQLALVVGAPWGELTLGGRWKGVLPGRMRVVALLSAMLMLAFAAVVAARAGLAFASAASLSRPLAWAVVGACALSGVANAASPSRRERAIWLPVAACLLASSAVVAAS